MQGVGTTPLAVARRPGAASLAVDVAVFVVGRFWGLVRGAVTTLRRRAPSWSTPGAPQLVTWGMQPAFASPRPRPLARPPVTGHIGLGASEQRELALPADPTAPRQARSLLQAAAQEWNLDDDLHQDAAMVVTELVANAVDHARTPSTLTVGRDEYGGLRIAVRDGLPGPVPRPLPVDPAAPRGRGLQMITALASSWGVTTHIDGKTVWAVLPRADEERTG
jgi:anti-sigma regulatory factor (Ser/Thr protein kinase)